MYCPNDKLKVNRFQPVALPRNCEYMRRYGKVTPLNNMYSGDEYIGFEKNKVDMLADAARYDAMMQAEEDAKANQDES